MKHQYFGDTRDLFKYDLLTILVSQIPKLTRILSIPMLTPDDGSSDGRRTCFRDSHAGYRNTTLREFLSAQQTSRNIARIADYFGEMRICMDIFDQPFTAEDRSTYFSSVVRFCTGRPGSLIFLDPDTGLEVKRPGEKHLLFSELQAVCRAADPPSVLMMYQHLPRVRREDYVVFRLSQLRNCCRRTPLALADRQVIFFLLPAAEIEGQVHSALHRYAGEYPVLRCWP